MSGVGRGRAPALVQVHLRLRKDDVAELKARALEIGLPYQVYIRTFMHQALGQKNGKGIIR